jgi:hypothetical protein
MAKNIDCLRKVNVMPLIIFLSVLGIFSKIQSSKLSKINQSYDEQNNVDYIFASIVNQLNLGDNIEETK